MSDTSLVFNLVGNDRVSRVLGVIRSSFQSAGRTAEESMRRADVSTERLDRQIQETERHLAELNREFAETGDKTLFGKMSRDRTLLTQLRRIRDEIGRTNDEATRSGGLRRWLESLGDGSSAVGRLAGSVGALGATAASAAGPLGVLAAAIGGVVGAAFALGPALAVAGGALGSLPGLAAGAGAAFGSLKLGLFGLSSEYERLTKASGGGGGGAAAASRDFTAQQRAVEQAVKQVARAERDLKDAQRDALRAQQDINAARKEAADRLRDQAMDLQDARISEADAVDDLQQAEQDLAAARAKGDPEEIDDAQRAYDRAALAVERAKVRTQELEDATAENTRTGVEGAREVVAAKEREVEATRRVRDAEEQRAEAIQRVKDAQKALRDAQNQGSGGGGGGGGGEQITKLAPSARAFLNTIIGLRPAFEELRLGVQEKLFAGLAGRMQHLADVWKGPLTNTLGSFATTFNGVAKTFFDTASNKTFIDNIAAGAESARKMIERVGQAVAGPLVDAFGRLAGASGPFLEKVGDLIGGAVERFSAWIKKADESGKLTRFFEGAARSLEKIWTLGGRVGQVIGKFVGIVFGNAQAEGDSIIDSINDGLLKVSRWLDRPESQQQIRDLIDGAMELAKQVGVIGAKFAEWGPIVGPALNVFGFGVKVVTLALRGMFLPFEAVIKLVGWIIRNGPGAWTGFKNGLSSAWTWVRDRGGKIISWVKDLPGRIRRASSGMWDGFKNAFRSALNWIIGKWNGLAFNLPSITFLGQTVGGGRVGMPRIDYLAQGAIVPATPGGRLAVIGEGREPEAVIPLSKLSEMMPARAQHIDVTVRLDFGTSELGQLMAKTVRTQPAVAAEMGKYLRVRVTA